MKTAYNVRDFVEAFGAQGSVDAFKAKLAENGISTASTFKEFFNSDALAGMVPPAFLSQILTGALHNPIARKVANVIPMDFGDSITVRRASETGEAQILAEGTSADIDDVTFAKEVYEYVKIAKRPGWTYEALADYPLDLIAINNQLMGATISAKEDQLMFGELFKQIGAGSTYEINPASAGVFTVDDLLETIADVQGVKNFYKADTLIMNLANYKKLLKSSDLRNAAFMGNSVINDQGQLTRFLGCDIYVANIVKNGTKGAYTAINDVYAFDSKYAIGLIERQGLTIENWNLPERQMHNAMITERVVPVVLQPEAIRRLKLS